MIIILICLSQRYVFPSQFHSFFLPTSRAKRICGCCLSCEGVEHIWDFTFLKNNNNSIHSEWGMRSNKGWNEMSKVLKHIFKVMLLSHRPVNHFIYRAFLDVSYLTFVLSIFLHIFLLICVESAIEFGLDAASSQKYALACLCSTLGFASGDLFNYNILFTRVLMFQV